MGAVTSSSGSPASTTRPSGTAHTSPLKPSPAKPSRVAGSRPRLASSQSSSSAEDPKRSRKLQAVGQARRDQEAPVGRELADKQAEGRGSGHPAPQVHHRHVELIEVGQQPAAAVAFSRSLCTAHPNPAHWTANANPTLPPWPAPLQGQTVGPAWQGRLRPYWAHSAPGAERRPLPKGRKMAHASLVRSFVRRVGCRAWGRGWVRNAKTATLMVE